MKLFIGLFGILYLGLVIGLRTFLVWRRTGHNPIAFRRDDELDLYIGRSFVAIELFWVAAIASFIFDTETWTVPMEALRDPVIAWVGAGFFVASTLWTLAAQSQMGTNWRVGIDQTHPTDLVARGLFRWSRNPIFLGIQVASVGAFLCVPSAVTLVAVVLGHVVIQIQVRREEAFLAQRHGASYAAYRQAVRRWV